MRIFSKRVRSVIAGVCFVGLLILLLYVLQRLLVPKYQTGVVEGSMVEEYYKDETKHDVIMVGDCEIYENFSTAELWRKYGITSYLRGSAQQLAWQSYYMLEDTLRYETPKVVVFNVFSLKYSEPQSEAYNRMTLDGMKWSSSKIDAIKASMTEDENFVDYVFPILRYHSRWSELDEDDFKHIFSKDLVTHNGYYMRADVRPEGEFPDPMPLADYTFGEKPMEYLERMKDLCKKNDIKLVLIKSPVKYPYWYEEWDKQVSDFADKNDLTYINMIKDIDKIGLDMSKDTYDAGLHLNINGAEKLSDYFGKWLMDNCGLTDHRSDEELSAYYDKLCENYDNERQSQLKEIEENGKLISKAPVEQKETMDLKKFIILAIAAVLCLCFVACKADDSSKAESSAASSSAADSSGSSQAADSSKSGEDNKSGDSFRFKLKDVDFTVKDDMAPIAEKLGEPTKYFESESCAYQGLDKVYTYGSVVIRTYPENDKDYVLNVELKDDSVSTVEGVSIGDNRDKVKQTYGEPEKSTDTSDVFHKGDCTISFMYGSDGAVSSIVYAIAK